MERESFSSRLGFILISAGCAIGLGNVWRFPFVTGQYGGASFVLIYLCFLLLLGLPKRGSNLEWISSQLIVAVISLSKKQN